MKYTRSLILFLVTLHVTVPYPQVCYVELHGWTKLATGLQLSNCTSSVQMFRDTPFPPTQCLSVWGFSPFLLFVCINLIISFFLDLRLSWRCEYTVDGLLDSEEHTAFIFNRVDEGSILLLNVC
jgi:hypothetical protein